MRHDTVTDMIEAPTRTEARMKAERFAFDHFAHDGDTGPIHYSEAHETYWCRTRRKRVRNNHAFGDTPAVGMVEAVAAMGRGVIL